MTRTYKTTKTKQEEMANKVKRNITGILVLSVIFILAAFFFAPKVGYIFGFFSKYRNDDQSGALAKISSPVFKEVPAATKEDEISLSGYSQVGSTVIVYVNGPETAKTLTGNDGEFTLEKVKLIKGRNTVFAKAVDAAGSESDKTNTYTVILDTEAPDIELESPKDGDTIKNLNSRITISGKINEKATIKINDRVAVQKPDYSFDFLLGVSEGDVKIKIVVTDEAGNEKTKELTVKYEKKSD